jgi:hypothetical protein
VSPAPFFVDSYAALTETAIADLLTRSGGVPPLAWGRYMDADLSKDLDVSAAHGFPLLLISRRSARVCLGREAGAHDGATDRATAEHWLAQARARGATVLRCVFLDVEMAPNLTSDYWRAWSAAFDGSELVPCAYMPNRNYWPASWGALERAVADGAPCGGVWVALYRQPTDGSAVMRDEPWARRPMASDRVPYLAWQDTGNAYGSRYDFSMTNPDASGWIGDTLPAAPPVLEVPRADGADPAPMATAAQGADPS